MHDMFPPGLDDVVKLSLAHLVRDHMGLDESVDVNFYITLNNSKRFKKLYAQWLPEFHRLGKRVAAIAERHGTESRQYRRDYERMNRHYIRMQQDMRDLIREAMTAVRREITIEQNKEAKAFKL